MVFGVNNIKVALDEKVKKDEPVLLIMGSNPLSYAVVNAFYKNCYHSGRCSDAELDFLKEMKDKFEFYPEKQGDLLHPKNFKDTPAKVEQEITKEETPPTEDPVPDERSTEEVADESPVTEDFDEDRKTIDDSEPEVKEPDTGVKVTREEKPKENGASDSAIDDIK